MKLKRISQIVLLSTVILGGSAAYAAETQADWATTLNVKLALLNKLGTDSLHVDVDAKAGAVTLTGTVHKRETRELAETIAKSVKGVSSVDNDVVFEANATNPSKVGAAAGEAEAEVKDALLETKVRIALVDKLDSNGFKIGTEAASGVVTLEFDRDFSAMQRQEAIKIVKGVDGVTKVLSVDKKA